MSTLDKCFTAKTSHLILQPQTKRSSRVPQTPHSWQADVMLLLLEDTIDYSKISGEITAILSSGFIDRVDFLLKGI